jgi:hypothetical protein
MLSFTSNTGTINRKSILDFLDTRKEILNWYAAMPDTILFVSRDSSFSVSQLLSNRFGRDLTFILSEIDGVTTDGAINQPVWDFINTPKSSGRWE